MSPPRDAPRVEEVAMFDCRPNGGYQPVPTKTGPSGPDPVADVNVPGAPALHPLSRITNGVVGRFLAYLGRVRYGLSRPWSQGSHS